MTQRKKPQRKSTEEKNIVKSPIDPYEQLDFDNAQQLVGKRQRYIRKPKKSADVMARLLARKGYGQQQTSMQLVDAWNIVIGDKHGSEIFAEACWKFM